ncbi:hypothetical protein E2320_022624 [Naja naja]|nr:hypothetical protein E2320_022624 [Naja naja]
MVLSCGHNFCRHCLAQLGPEASCPQCRAKVETGSACPNRALANMVRLVKRLRLSEGAQEESSGQWLCQEHKKPLQSFCSRETSLLCPGCLEGHQGHPLLSLPEAAQQYKVGTNSLGFSIRHRGPPKSPERWEELPGSSERPTKATKFRNGGGEPGSFSAVSEEKDLLVGLLEPLRKEEQKLLEQRQAEEQSQQQFQELLAAERQEVGLALESLQELLRERQPVWLGWLAEQEEKMEAERGVAVAQLSGEASRLQQLMAQMERKCRQPDAEFLQDIQDTVDR